jgi:hypothetical protein
MIHPMSLKPRERAALSRLRQILNEPVLLRANCVKRKHPCGRDSCHCSSSRQHWHLSWYVSQSRKGKLRTKYVPPERVAEVRRWVACYQQARRLLMTVGDAFWDRITP